jgi:hypothetical protein
MASQQLDIIPVGQSRPQTSRQSSALEKSTSEFVEHSGDKRDAAALYDADLMAGERVEAVSLSSGIVGKAV